MLKKKNGRKLVLESREHVLLDQLIQRCRFTEETVKKDSSIEFYGYVKQEMGISYTALSRITKEGRTFFRETEGDLGIIRFLDPADDRYLFVGRDTGTDRFQIVFAAKRNGVPLDLTMAWPDKQFLYVPEAGQNGVIKLPLTR